MNFLKKLFGMCTHSWIEVERLDYIEKNTTHKIGYATFERRVCDVTDEPMVKFVFQCQNCGTKKIVKG